jgi:hypothetical protein
MADERPQRGFRNDRTPFGDRDRRPFPPSGGGRPPFRGGAETAMPAHTLRLRDGDREIEVSGSPPFVRQVLDDLPALLAKLSGDAAVRPQAIRMPSPQPAAAAAPPPAAPVLEVVGSPQDDGAAASGNGSVEQRVLQILRDSRKPLAVAAIRKRLGPEVTPQQVRRVLERAGGQVTASGQRPATYRLTGR